MRLTDKQYHALIEIRLSPHIQVGCCEIHGRTLNSLFGKGLITSRNYANGEFLEITDEGMKHTDHEY